MIFRKVGDLDLHVHNVTTGESHGELTHVWLCFDCGGLIGDREKHIWHCNSNPPESGSEVQRHDGSEGA